MAEDFDGLDALLKLYYLLQASYHVHSGAFHILTMVLLWTRRQRYPGDNNTINDNNNNNKARTKHRQDRATAKPFTAYWRSLLQHCIALLLIGGSHLFASTRRLGAIGNFALDASSLSLHVLQLCINAPISIPPIYIEILHRGLVIPLFVYCRFYVWPFVVWRSAMFESKEWLQQMESTLFPGIYRAMMYVFTGLTVILLGLNLVLFRRLVNHPHLQRVYRNHHDNDNDYNNINKKMVVQ
jgi:TLC domain